MWRQVFCTVYDHANMPHKSLWEVSPYYASKTACGARGKPCQIIWRTPAFYLSNHNQMLGAAIIHPAQRAVIPLMPEPIVHRDGTDNNDCERNATKRFVGKLRQDHPHLKFISTEDSLSANAPHIATLQDHDLRSILGVKEGDHAYVFQQGKAAEQAGRVTYYERHERAAGLVHRFRFVNDMPLNASQATVRVHVIEYWEIGDEKVQHFRWVTD